MVLTFIFLMASIEGKLTIVAKTESHTPVRELVTSYQKISTGFNIEVFVTGICIK